MANCSSFLSLQFSQALAIRSYTKFVMGVSQASCPSHFPLPWGPGGTREAHSGGGWRPAEVSSVGSVCPCSLGPSRAGEGVTDTQSPGFQIAVSMLTYPFLLVGDLMAVNNCG